MTSRIRERLARAGLIGLVSSLGALCVVGALVIAGEAWVSAQSVLTPARAEATLTAARAAAGSPPALLVIGDSLTAGVGASQWRASYPSDLARLLGARNAGDGDHSMTWVALGQAGYASDQMRDALRGVTLPRPTALTVVEIGTNDWAQSRPLAAFTRDYTALLALAMSSSPRQILCLSGWPHSDAATNALGLPMSAYDAVIAQACQRASATALYVDVTAIAAVPADHAGGDGYHPNDRGCAAIAQAIVAALSQ